MNKSILVSILAIILLSISFTMSSTNADTGKKKIAPFVDPNKDPQSYVKRYQNEPTYKTWFDKNYGSKYKSIYEAVGLPEPISLVKNEKSSKNLFPSSPPKKSSNTYVNDVLGFQFNPPNGWVEGEAPEHALLAFYSKSENSGIAVAYKQFLKIPPDQWNFFLNKIGTQKKKEFEKIFTDGLLKAQPAGYKGSPVKFTYYPEGLKITWSFAYVHWTDGIQYQIKGNSVAWWWSEKGDLYELDYFANSDEYKTYYPSFKTAVDTFYVYPTSFEDS